MEEFDNAVDTLRSNNIKVSKTFQFTDDFYNSLFLQVTVIQDTPYFIKPDAVFPNNWLSVHQSGELVLYPMATSNRRLERRQDIIQWIKVIKLINY